jgi:thiamine biosynthesis lipoprotein
MILRLATHAMGTRFELVLAGADEPRLRAAGEGAIAVIQEWHARLNRFARDSQLSFINREAAGRSVPLDRDLFDALLLCRNVNALSGGAFDPTVAPRMDALRGDAAGDLPIGFHGVFLDAAACSISFDRPGLALDLGGLAKGLALDHAAAELRACGVERALLHGGASSIVAIGSPPQRPSWLIAVEAAGSLARVNLRDAHLSVSSPAGRTFPSGQATRGHIVDPRGGAPPLDRTALVLADSGTAAEAWSTALAVTGVVPEAFPPELTAAIHDPARGWSVHGPRGVLVQFDPAHQHRTEVA